MKSIENNIRTQIYRNEWKILNVIKEYVDKSYSLLDQILVSGGSFLTIAVCAHILPLDEQGKLTYTYACYMILLLINIGGIFQGASVRAPSDTNKIHYKVSLLYLQIAMAFILTTVVIGCLQLFGKSIDWKPSSYEFLYLFLFLFLQQLADFDRRSSYIFSEPKRAFLSSLFMYPIRVALLLLCPNSDFHSVLIILTITTIIPVFFLIKEILRYVNNSEIRDYIARAIEHLSFSKLLILNAPLGWLWSYIPVFALGALHGKESVALLVSIRSLGNVANVLMEQLETTVSARLALELYSTGKEGMDAVMQVLIRSGLIIWLVGLIAILFYSKELVLISLGLNYVPYKGILLISWIAYGIYFISRLFGLKHRTYKNLRVELAGNVATALAAAISAYPLIMLFGVFGAAWIFVIIALAGAAVQIAVAKKGDI